MTETTTIGEALADAIGRDHVVVEPEAMTPYLHDEAEWAPYGRPAAVVRPRSTEQVQRTVAVCAERGVPIVPRGAGTGLSGGANAADGCVVLVMAQMNEIVEIDPAEKIATVQPGVVNDDLRAACAKVGLWYPPDPASSPWSTIGGNVSTNAGGVCCVKYGVTRDYVLGLEAVVAYGDAVRLGRRTAKGVAGYDLCGLFVGAEGTLGVITEVTVRLRAQREPEHTVVGCFSSLAAVGRAIENVAAGDVVPSALELLDRHCLSAVDAWKRMGLTADGDYLLLGRCDGVGDLGGREAASILDCFRHAGATWAERSTSQDEADALFAARRLAYPALERLGPVLTEDVCVPKMRVTDMLDRIRVAGEDNDVLIAIIAHAGDGNLHPLLITPPGDDGARRRAQRAFEQIMSDAIALGGTITGEHGVGLLKSRALHAELGPRVVAMHQSIKDALDPQGIFNPGKVW